MQASISIIGLDEQLKRLEPANAQRIASFGLEVLADAFENKVGLEANQTVYSYKPKTNSYKRTGRLLGGRGKANAGGKPDRKQLDKNTIRVQASPTLKGAPFDYAPFVNAGTGWMKRVGARPFWTNSGKWAENQGVKIAQREMSKKIKDL